MDAGRPACNASAFSWRIVFNSAAGTSVFGPAIPSYEGNAYASEPASACHIPPSTPIAFAKKRGIARTCRKLLLQPIVDPPVGPTGNEELIAVGDVPAGPCYQLLGSRDARASEVCWND